MNSTRELTSAAVQLERQLCRSSRPAGSRSPTVRAVSRETAEYFVTQVLPGMREGHEVLTRSAASGLAGVDLPALLRGVTRVDAGKSRLSLPGALLDSLRPAQQRRHVLRATLCQTVRDALSATRNHLVLLHSNALTAPSRSAAFEWIGEGLHIVQDSYSAAHTERAFGAGSGGTHPIRYIRFFGFMRRLPPQFTSPPREHAFPTDPRDQITDAAGRLRPESTIAISASREFVEMMIRHLGRAGSPSNATELRAFMDKHLALSTRPLDVRSFHPQCGTPPPGSRLAEAMAEPARVPYLTPVPGGRGGGEPPDPVLQWLRDARAQIARATWAAQNPWRGRQAAQQALQRAQVDLTQVRSRLQGGGFAGVPQVAGAAQQALTMASRRLTSGNLAGMRNFLTTATARILDAIQRRGGA